MQTIKVHYMKEEDEEEEEVKGGGGEGGGQGSPIYGDLLEEVFARVPLIDLACASRVSKSWEFAVSSSLFHINRVKPWLMVHIQNTVSLNKKITTHAYDPRSSTWVEVCQLLNPTKQISPLQSLGSTLLYELSFEGLSYSVDPLHCTWHHIPPPSIWRVDPIVALVGSHFIVTGGGSNYWNIDDPLTVEMYDMEACCWSTCQSMPTVLKDSAASTWLSIASDQHTMYVTEKASGTTYTFSPKTKSWFGPYNLRPEPGVYFSTIGFAGEELILAGLIGQPEDVKNLKLWKVNLETMEFDVFGEIPPEFLKKLIGENSNDGLSSITLLAIENYSYIYKSSDPFEIIICEFVGGKCKWDSVQNMALLDDDSKICKKMVMSCGRVGIGDLHMAMSSNKLKFVEKSNVSN